MNKKEIINKFSTLMDAYDSSYKDFLAENKWPPTLAPVTKAYRDLLDFVVDVKQEQGFVTADFEEVPEADNENI